MAATSKAPRQRLDVLLVERGLAPSREHARALILAREVLLNGAPALRPAEPVRPDVELSVRASSPFVSRGGEKLAGALASFGLEVAGLIALDVGASTGGFTDCLLRAGAARVIAVDVGYGQLAWSLRSDPRVVVLERMNARGLDAAALPETPALAVIDVSFISLALVLPPVVAVLPPGGRIVALVKPQFEVGKGQVGKGGVVRDPALRASAVANVRTVAEGLGLVVDGEADSVLPGPKGNQETFLLLRRL